MRTIKQLLFATLIETLKVIAFSLHRAVFTRMTSIAMPKVTDLWYQWPHIKLDQLTHL